MFNWIAIVFLPFLASGQSTAGGITGLVMTLTGEPLTGAQVVIVHEPTHTRYKTASGRGGLYLIEDLAPGGPYTVSAYFNGLHPARKTDVFIDIGRSENVGLFLARRDSQTAVTVTSFTTRKELASRSFFIADTMLFRLLPSGGQNLYEYISLMPHAGLLSGSDDALSIAGQNNRFNAFYIDGALNNDVFGLSASGVNGGQAGGFPVALESIGQVQVSASPYDPAFGNFTGGAINAVTRSGHNHSRSSVYFSVNNRLPANLSSGNGARFRGVSSSVSGAWASGAITRNRCFYFVSVESQQSQLRQWTELSAYPGNITAAGLQGLADIVKKLYRYDMGYFDHADRLLGSGKMALRIDYNPGEQNRFSFTWRYNRATAQYPPLPAAGTVQFSNGSVIVPNRTTTAGVEWKAHRGKFYNKFSFTYSQVDDDRSFAGQPFPRVTVYDGDGSIFFGSDPSSTQNRLRQANTGCTDVLKYAAGRHLLSAGIDLSHAADRNVFIQRSFGTFEYGSVSAFESNGAAPSSYERGIALPDGNISDETASSARFSVLRWSVFLSDEWKLSKQFSMMAGARIDRWKFLSAPAPDPFLRDTALPAIRTFYDLEGAASGRAPDISTSFSPRLCISWQLPHSGLSVYAGSGVFNGRMPLAWPAGVYYNNGLLTGTFIGNSSVRFRWNANNPARSVYTQADAAGVMLRGSVNLVPAQLHMPSVWRSSVAVYQKISEHWTVHADAIYSRNLGEILYTNVNLAPPAGNSAGPGSRSVYARDSLGIPARIPMGAGNPYEDIILLSNNHQQRRGYSFDVEAGITGRSRGGMITASCAYGRSMVWNEGTSTVNSSQWKNMETINGHNNQFLSVSDFSPALRLGLIYTRPAAGGTLSLVYQGRSGSPFSYVYSGRSPAGDASGAGFYDLVYIPRSDELAAQQFLPFTRHGVTVDGSQQKAALETLIKGNRYLSAHRGGFAERNGARMPFSQRIDAKWHTQFILKKGGGRSRLETGVELYNLLNFINNSWARQNEPAFNQVALLEFDGYDSSGLPMARFKGLPDVSESGAQRWWGIQLGVKIILE